MIYYNKALFSWGDPAECLSETTTTTIKRPLRRSHRQSLDTMMQMRSVDTRAAYVETA